MPTEQTNVSGAQFGKIAGMVLNHFELTGQALDLVQSRHKEAEATQKTASSSIPVVVDSLVELNLIQPSEKDAAATKLASHAGALEMVQTACKLAADSVNSTKGAATKVATDYLGAPAPAAQSNVVEKTRGSVHVMGGLNKSASAADAAFFNRMTSN